MSTDPHINRLQALAEVEPAAAASLARLLVRRDEPRALRALCERLLGSGRYTEAQVGALLLDAGAAAQWHIEDSALWQSPFLRSPRGQAQAARSAPYPLRSLTEIDHLDAPTHCWRSLHIAGLVVEVRWDLDRARRLVFDCGAAAAAVTAALCGLPRAPATAPSMPRSGEATPHGAARSVYMAANSVLHDALDAALDALSEAPDPQVSSLDQPKLYALSHALLVAHLRLQADLLVAHYLEQRGEGPLEAAPLWGRLQSRFFQALNLCGRVGDGPAAGEALVEGAALVDG